MTTTANVLRRPAIPAKVKRLVARPSEAAHLSFEVGGILGVMNATLGASVTAFPFQTFYDGLGATAPYTLVFGVARAADPSLLVYNSNGIYNDSAVQGSLLAALRAEPAKAALDSAVKARQNAYFKKYANQSTIITKMRQNYDASSGSGSKPALLSDLVATSQNQAMMLDTAYSSETPPRTGVVKSTTSALSSTTNSNGGSFATTYANVIGQTSQQSGPNSQLNGEPATVVYQQELGFWNFNGETPTSWTPYPSVQQPSQMITVTPPMEGNNSSTSNGNIQTITNGTASQTQTTLNTDYGYRVPALENKAQFDRAQISLMDEQFALFMRTQDLTRLEAVFANELQGIDLGVKRLQVGYLNTLLMSPVGGVVTGIFKHLGEWVRPGEPVLRVENNASVYLVGTLICRDPIVIGTNATITTTLFGAASSTAAPLTTTPSSTTTTSSTTLTGVVVASRGRTAEDEWDVVIRCSNLVPNTTKTVLPINYPFDFDDTTVSIG